METLLYSYCLFISFLSASRCNYWSACACHRRQWFWFVWNLHIFYRCLNMKVTVCSTLPQTRSQGFLSSELTIMLFTISLAVAEKFIRFSHFCRRLHSLTVAWLQGSRNSSGCRAFLYILSRTPRAIRHHVYPYGFPLRCWDRDWTFKYTGKRG